LHILYKKSLSVPKLSNEYKILKETSELLLLSLENTLKELQKKENLNVHNVIKQSNTEIRAPLKTHHKSSIW